MKQIDNFMTTYKFLTKERLKYFSWISSDLIQNRTLELLSGHEGLP